MSRKVCGRETSIVAPLRQSGQDHTIEERLMPITRTPGITVDAAGDRTINKEHRGVRISALLPKNRRSTGFPLR